MEPILSKLQEGVKYPRFERDATKTINDLVDHITKERGVYSSSIEPNPSEHSIWFNTNDNTLYIYDGNTWATISHNNINIAKDGEFYSYPVINVYDENIDMYDWAIEENKHYIIIINTNNIREYLNNIVMATDSMNCIIIGDNINISGTFLVNIYNNYIYYIKLSSSYIKEDNVFYCTEGMLYYDADNTNHDGEGLNIRGFYTKERLRDIIEDYEGISIETLMLNNVFIEPEDESTIIIGKQVFDCDVSILGSDLDNANIYMYNNILHIGNTGDNFNDFNNLNWYNVTVYCNCKSIGDITITHEGSNMPLQIDSINFIVGNNNHLKIEQILSDCIQECNIYVINETDNDKSDVLIQGTIFNGIIDTYINLCGTKMLVVEPGRICCNTFITTTLDDINYNIINDIPIDFESCRQLILDAPFKTIQTSVINYLKGYKNLKIYSTEPTVCTYLNGQGLQTTRVYRNSSRYTDRIVVVYKLNNNTDIFNRTIYTH